MAIWIQSLSWALIYALGQGLIVYVALWLVLKLVPASSSNLRYHLSLSALAMLFVWFIGTWWQQFHLLADNQASAPWTILYLGSTASGAATSLYNSNLLRHSFNIIAPWLSLCYVAGLFFMLFRLSGGLVHLSKLRKTGLSPATAAIGDLLAMLKAKLDVSGPLQLFVSAKARVPMVIGFLKPVILLPAAALTDLNAHQLEAILLHELAHIKRNDYLVNILQACVETVLFFNPFVWMISSLARREREHCCDDMVLAHSREPLEYATALAALATPSANLSALTIAASGKNNYLFHRIKRIMEMKKSSFSYSRMAAAVLLVLVITCSVAWLAPSFARPGKNKTVKTAPDVTATIDKAGTTSTAATPAQPSAGNDLKPTATQEKPIAVKPVKDVVPVPSNMPPANTNVSEEQQLVQLLLNDKVVDEINGFVVEAKAGKLYIDGKEQTDDFSAKYLSSKSSLLRVQVFPLTERLRMHPDGGLIKNLMPVTLSSGCVNYRSGKKPGC